MLLWIIGSEFEARYFARIIIHAIIHYIIHDVIHYVIDYIIHIANYANYACMNASCNMHIEWDACSNASILGGGSLPDPRS